MSKLKISYDFPRFFEAITSTKGLEDPQLAILFRNLVRELEKLHRELARVNNNDMGDNHWTVISSFTNGWTAYSGYSVRYMKIRQDLVMLDGAITPGTIGAAAFTLPTGYRPSQYQIGRALQANSPYMARVDITNTGIVIPYAPTLVGSGWVSLAGIIFQV